MIRGNSAIMKCKMPSFVSEFIYVDQWVASDGSIYTAGREYGMGLRRRRAYMYIDVKAVGGQKLAAQSAARVVAGRSPPSKLNDRPRLDLYWTVFLSNIAINKFPSIIIHRNVSKICEIPKMRSK